MLIVFPDTAEHNGWYSEGSHTRFSELYVIRAPSEIKAPPWYWGVWGPITLGVIFEVDGAIYALVMILPISMWRYEPVVSNDMLTSALPTLNVWRHSPLLASQILTVPSYDVDASRVESWEKATDQMELLWPLSACRHSPLFVDEGMAGVPVDLCVNRDSLSSSFWIWLLMDSTSSVDGWLAGVETPIELIGIGIVCDPGTDLHLWESSLTSAATFRSKKRASPNTYLRVFQHQQGFYSFNRFVSCCLAFLDCIKFSVARRACKNCVAVRTSSWMCSDTYTASLLRRCSGSAIVFFIPASDLFKAL